MLPPAGWAANRVGGFMPTTSDWKTLKFQVTKEIGLLTINREKSLNALNGEALEELQKLLEQLLQQKGRIRGLILVGAGTKSFIAGADIKGMSAMNSGEALEFGKLGQRVTTLLEELPLPVIACVNGLALGGGQEIAMSCDFILASKNAVFGQPEVKLGLIPGFGGTQRLSRIVGRNWAREIIYTGRHLTAQEALELGLVLKVLPSKKSLLEEAHKILDAIFKNSSRAVALAKGAINEGSDLPLAKGLECELEYFSSIFGSADMREGTKAFLEKRPPQFKSHSS